MDTTVKKPVRFCNPVEKTEVEEPELGEIIDPTAHLTCYEIDEVESEPAFVKRSVLVTNQIVTDQRLDLVEPSELCVPSEKNDVDSDLDHLDHFKCYKLERKRGQNAYPPLPVTVALEDQFDSGPVNYIIEKPFRFCNPVSKNGEEILDPEGHLTCYKIKRETSVSFQKVTIESDNQFQDDQMLNLLESDTLCIPSLKALP